MPMPTAEEQREYQRRWAAERRRAKGIPERPAVSANQVRQSRLERNKRFRSKNRKRLYAKERMRKLGVRYGEHNESAALLIELRRELKGKYHGKK